MVLAAWKEEAPNLSYKEILKARIIHKKGLKEWDKVTFRKFIKGRSEHRKDKYWEFDESYFINEFKSEMIDGFNYLMVMYPFWLEYNRRTQEVNMVPPERKKHNGYSLYHNSFIRFIDFITLGLVSAIKERFKDN